MVGRIYFAKKLYFGKIASKDFYTVLGEIGTEMLLNSYDIIRICGERN